ncbi:MAG TPA: alkaline phosphatase family protein [Myxococcales bacterium]
MHLCPHLQTPALRIVAVLAAISTVCCGGSNGSAGPSAASLPGAPAQPPAAGTPPADAPPAPPASSTPALSGISTGSVLAGPVALNATVPAGTASAEFQLDGAPIATVAAAPFIASWDSFSVANGTHALAVRATDASGAVTASDPVQVTVSNHIKNVFVIVFENHDWSSIKGSSAAPYINGTLLVQGAHADNYMNVPNLHPSLPNYIWLESGSTQGVTNDDVPANHRLTSTQHLVTLLQNAGVTWKSYQEDIPGTDCPLGLVNNYAPKHNPMVYFTDVNGGVDPASANCISHVRPYAELQTDLEANTVAAYNFITPNLCNDMHDCSVATGDAWLAREVPKILASKAYKEGGALFITFDESAGSNVPIGFMVMSPLAKPGYAGQVAYSHSSTLRSVQEIFGVAPFLGDAANANDLSDLFKSFP